MARTPGAKNKKTIMKEMTSNNLNDDEKDIKTSDDVTEIIGDAVITDLNTGVSADVSPEKKERLTKKEKAAAEIKARIDSLTDTDVKGFSGLVDVLFTVISVRAGDHWKLSQEEADILGKNIAVVGAKYNLTSFGFMQETMLGVSLIGILMPRIKKTVADKKADTPDGEFVKIAARVSE